MTRPRASVTIDRTLHRRLKVRAARKRRKMIHELDDLLREILDVRDAIEHGVYVPTVPGPGSH